MISSQDLVALSTYAAYDRSVNYGSIVYGVDGHQFKVIDRTTSDPQAILAESQTEPFETAIIFEGTVDSDDWKNDVENGLDLQPEQYENALKVFDKLSLESENHSKKKPRYVAGNSLGGGLANYTAMKRNDLHSVTINPSIVPAGTKVESNSTYTNYISNNDQLNKLQEAAGKKDGRVPGEQVIIPSGAPNAKDVVRSHKGLDKYGKSEAAQMIPKSLIGGVGIGDSNKSQQEKDNGANHDIAINPEILSNMMTELTNESDTVDKFILANIETSTKILETENKQLEARQDNLKYEQKDIVNSVLFKGLNIGIDALLDITQKYSIWDILDHELNGLFNCEYHAVVGLLNLLGLNDEIDDMDAKLDALVSGLNSFFDVEVPKLFEKYNFNDGTVLKLIDYQNLIVKNLNTFKNNIEVINAQTGYIKETMTSGDNSYFTNSETSFKGEFVDLVIDDGAVEHSKKLLDDHFNGNFNNFINAFDEQVRPLYNNLLASATNFINIERNHFIANKLDDLPVEKMQNILNTIEKVCNYLNKNDLPQIIIEELIQNKDMIKTAIFADDIFELINTYNTEAYNYMQKIDQDFNLTKQELDKNSGVVIDRLKEIFNIISNQSSMLIGQIEDIVVE